VLIGKDGGEGQQGRHPAGNLYRPPNQDEEVDVVFYKWTTEVSQFLAFVLTGDFNLLDICWKYNTAERKQSRRFLECVEDIFPT